MNDFYYPRQIVYFYFLIQIPYPLETTEVSSWPFQLNRDEMITNNGSYKQLQNASRRALDLWSRDAPSVGFAAPRSKDESEISYYAQTLIGSGSRDVLAHSPADDHRILCNNCHRVSQLKTLLISSFFCLDLLSFFPVRFFIDDCRC